MWREMEIKVRRRSGGRYVDMGGGDWVRERDENQCIFSARLCLNISFNIFTGRDNVMTQRKRVNILPYCLSSNVT
jgi:hypothetical protein